MCMYIVENEQKPSKSHSGYTKKIMIMNKTHEKNFPVKSKIIAVWGSPHSGRTTLAVKISKAIYDNYSTKVICVCCDNKTPALPVLLPEKKSDELFSIGAALSKTEITQQDVLKSLVTVKGKRNFALLGYMDGENKYSYPDYSEEKVNELLTVVRSLADYVIVDCSSSLNDILSLDTVREADAILRLCTPDLNCISFFSSQLPLLSDTKYRLDEHIQGLCVTEADVYMPVEEAKQHFRDIRFTIPYCKEVKEQMLDGRLLEDVHDKKYNKKLKTIMERLV